ncbi:dipicolinate synthase subunit DpsA [Pasteuria penetrans]|uniref:dipicolinate synthase subunit DpsA n=1 Tax=Pasteuria penetrans TaxID=86005 RepID=UPI000FAC4CA3|nr:dipicolinate synthase subunit DpsA [Pasteuria penetrans]
MLLGKTVAFFGGDTRQLAMIERFCRQRARVILFGFDQWSCPYSGVIFSDPNPDALLETNALILPAAGTNEEGHVISHYSDRELICTGDHIGALPHDAQVFSGTVSRYLEKLCNDYHVPLVGLFDRDDIAIRNAIPTVEAAIMLAIQNTPFTLHGSSCWVVGTGRVGFTLAHALSSLGARVMVTTYSSGERARAEAMGWRAYGVGDRLVCASVTDILFNTVPSMVISRKIIDAIPARAWILDLASSPGGVDHEYAAERGLKSLLAPSLPGKVAPETSGLLLANAIIEILQQDEEMREG